jgi:RNA polymerase sigma-70 factor (ECF subfamily)
MEAGMVAPPDDHPGKRMPSSTARVELVQILTRCQPVMRAYAYAILRDFHLAEDAAQEVALLVAERWDALPRDEALLAWVREATRRKALELRRKARTSRRHDREFAAHLSEETIAALEPHFRPAESEGDRADILQDCLHRLQAHTHDVIRARYGDSRSCEEIATRTGRTVQSVYGLLKRARLVLAECMDRRVAALERENRS